MLEAKRALTELLNAEHRDRGHVALGAVLCLGLVVGAAAVAAVASPSPDDPRVRAEDQALDKPRWQPSAMAFKFMWPAVFSVLTWSGVRVWNAPDGPARSRALGLWAAIQGLNALWMSWGPKRRLEQMLTGLATLGVTALYVAQARGVDEKAAGMVAPYAGWISLANLVTEELWRRNRAPHAGHTLH